MIMAYLLRLYLVKIRNCLNGVHNCDDHGLLVKIILGQNNQLELYFPEDDARRPGCISEWPIADVKW